jgi:hypothetical protein
MSRTHLNRREFLAAAGSLTAASLQAAPTTVAIVADPKDPVASSGQVKWAIGELKSALQAHEVRVITPGRVGEAGRSDHIVVVSKATDLNGPEQLSLARGRVDDRSVIVAQGSDPAGAKYAVLEMADRVRYDLEPMGVFSISESVTETPSNRIRSVTRCFVSDVEDKPWYNDKAMWPEYLNMLATQRFNRFSLAFGIGYDFLRQITDCYLHFAYPFLLDVPGYKVRARGLPDAERDHNLEMLKFISNEAEKRGLHFQLGLWTHGYQWTDSPNANYIIEGLTPENHATYCRDAIYQLLKACPAIRGVTLRIHGESGVAEGDYEFWKTLFSGIVKTGRKIEVDMHAKGMDFAMIDVALASGLPVNVSPKFWAEHMGLGYHQASIRELEMPPKDREDKGFFALSNGSRRFLRYGYGDLLRDDRKYGVLYRVWPGTQRILLSGDPMLASSYSKAASLAGSDGLELCEPLSFKGRKGTGLPGGRCAYSDATLNPKWDWQKFEYTYRIWGRKLYNADATGAIWHRYLAYKFGSDGQFYGVRLSSASRILPLITSAHGASGANNSYWPEIYTNMPIVAGKPSPYSDTPEPKKFGTVSPFDPELFYTVDEFASDLLSGKKSCKYSPVDVASWLEREAEIASTRMRPTDNLEARRWEIDVTIQAGIGRFFAAKFRSAVLYAIFEKTGDKGAIEQAVKQYRDARTAWAQLVDRAKDVYMKDISAGLGPNLRGQWADRLPAIDEDIADMAKKLEGAKPAAQANGAVAAVSGRPSMPILAEHTVPANFKPGEAVPLTFTSTGVKSVVLRYRHLNQAERFVSAEMTQRDGQFRGEIPGTYTQSPYSLQYYLDVRKSPTDATIFPGLQSLGHPPYFVIRRA